MLKSKKACFYILLVGIELLGLAIIAEVGIRFLSPQDTLYPRYQFSEKYGLSLFPNTVMTHSRPGRYLYRYTVNHAGYRGPYVDPAVVKDKFRVVVLGDSYSFGTGVQDGEEYPAIMQAQLGAAPYAVINLGSPAWTITQQIRRYYELGERYQPNLVILQFFENDPDELLKDQVTSFENGRFVFRDTDNRMQWIKKWMSESFFQKSQLYNLIRQSAYLYLNKRKIESLKKREASGGVVSSSDIAQKKYCDLLIPFAKELKIAGIPLIIVAVNDSLKANPVVERCIQSLREEGALEYADVLPWFEGMANFASPEGHYWGAQAHRIVGENLAEKIQQVKMMERGGTDIE